jgi:hypothetical protein
MNYETYIYVTYVTLTRTLTPNWSLFTLERMNEHEWRTLIDYNLNKLVHVVQKIPPPPHLCQLRKREPIFKNLLKILQNARGKYVFQVWSEIYVPSERLTNQRTLISWASTRHSSRLLQACHAACCYRVRHVRKCCGHCIHHATRMRLTFISCGWWPCLGLVIVAYGFCLWLVDGSFFAWTDTQDNFKHVFIPIL